MSYAKDAHVGGNYSDPLENLGEIGYVPEGDRLGIEIGGQTRLACSSIVSILGGVQHLDGIDGDPELNELLSDY